MESNSGDENSDDGLHIVLESPKPKKRTRKELDETDRQIIACVEKTLEENLEEKATKANLSSQNVKTIIKHIATNEHVVALVRQVENPDDNNEPITVYEPKYTRAKTKELLSTNTPPSVLPWALPPKSPSEVHMLFTEELQEDSSGDEYVPRRPKKNAPVANQPAVLQTKTKEKKANIALRTRSKLSLSHTPLEVIEEAFMPPDITTDMYNMDCDDDVWKEFLKTFTRPLDEVTKAAEDEDHDPEYNILADEEIDEVDKEELRADRAVTVSRKEFNCLMAELFEFADIYESNKLNEKTSTDEGNSFSVENFQQVDANPVESDPENDPNISIKKCQIPILAQQMRQHVQMLTHNFILTYEHPELSDMAPKFKELLESIKAESEGKTASIFHAINLKPALELIEYWEKMFATKSRKEVMETKQYVEKVIAESMGAKLAGTEYIVTFPPLVMKTISNSEVFIYPNLLPRIPFKSPNIFKNYHYFFTNSEDNLIALFLEQAIPSLKQDPFHLTKNKKVNMEHVCHYIHKFLMPCAKQTSIERHIRKRKNPASVENPIKFFYRNKKAPPTVHYVVPLDVLQIVPPCKRSPDSLPYQWRQYLYPEQERQQQHQRGQVINNNNNYNNQIIIVSSPLKLLPVTNVSVPSVYNINFAKNIIGQRKIKPKAPIPPPVICPRRKKRNYAQKTTEMSKPKCQEDKNTAVVSKEDDKMLPDMPSLGGTPVKNTIIEPDTSTIKNNEDANTKREQDLSFQNIANFNFQYYKPEATTQVRRNFEGICEFSNTFSSQNDANLSTSIDFTTTEKDNPDDINELMIASSTVKNIPRKEPSGAEKKRAKLRREFIANLVMATPDHPEIENQKDENFADAFFDKIRETLTSEDYDKLIDFLGHYDENSGQFIDLYNNVQSVLFPKYKELSEEFLLFLTDIQAHTVGKLMPYFIMKDMARFMKKLQVYFKEQPSQLKKIMKCLTDLSENADITMETVKSTILPLFKGNAALTDWFLQIFPSERPPNILSNGPFEIVNITTEFSRQPDEDIFETVVLPDTEDPYGGPTCICNCHNVENPKFKSRSQHCSKCGLKFIQGKIYIQTGKALRPAVVSFLTNPEKDHTKRLSASQRKRSETSPNKQVTSPNKESQTREEVRNHSNESDDECDGAKKKNQRPTKTQRKRKIKHRDKPNVVKDPGKPSKENSSKTCDKIKSDSVSTNSKPVKNSSKRQNKKRNSGKKAAEHKPGSSAGQQKRPAEEQLEIECCGPAELVELKVSSDHSGESESEFFESSQDITNTDSDDSVGSSNSSPIQQSDTTALWTREEDKTILQAFRQRNDNEETFKHISEVLQNRSVVEIKNRFHKLMNLLQQMASNSTS